jgi:8-oxo-dGTP pyrophosphatase MutT (NUDIX family)
LNEPFKSSEEGGVLIPGVNGQLPTQSFTGAGSIIFRRRGRQPEIFFSKNSYGRWTFPKGKQHPGEPLGLTAIRETKEESGLTGLKFVAPLGRTIFRYRREGVLIQKTVHFFLFEVPPDAKEVMTGVEGGIWEAQWVPLSRAIVVNGYRNLDRLLAKAIRIISERDRRTDSQYHRRGRFSGLSQRRHAAHRYPYRRHSHPGRMRIFPPGKQYVPSPPEDVQAPEVSF